MSVLGRDAFAAVTEKWVYGIANSIVSNHVLKEMRRPDAVSAPPVPAQRTATKANIPGDVLIECPLLPGHSPR